MYKYYRNQKYRELSMFNKINKEFSQHVVNGDYNEWSDWERCSLTCGGGKQFRSRTCTNPLAQYGGMNCDSKGPPREERICNTNLCPGNVELLEITR